MSPPLTLGLTGRLVAWAHRAPLVFNIQDVFPDAAVETGAITDRRIIRVASWLERLSYRVGRRRHGPLRRPAGQRRRQGAVAPHRHRPRHPQLRRHGADHARRPHDAVPPRARHRRRAGAAVRRQRRVLAVRRAAAGGGAGAPRCHRARQRRRRRPPGARGPVRRPGQRPVRRLRPRGAVGGAAGHGRRPRRAARRGLAAVSVPSKTYSILAAGRPVVAAIDADTEIPRLLAASGGGLAVPPDDPGGVHGRGHAAARRPGDGDGDGPARARLGRRRRLARPRSPPRTRRSSAPWPAGTSIPAP